MTPFHMEVEAQKLMATNIWMKKHTAKYCFKIRYRWERLLENINGGASKTYKKIL